MMGIHLKHLIWTGVGVGFIVLVTLLLTYVTLWGAAGVLPELGS